MTVEIKPALGGGCTISGDPDDGAFDSFYDPSFTLTPAEVRELIKRLEQYAAREEVVPSLQRMRLEERRDVVQFLREHAAGFRSPMAARDYVNGEIARELEAKALRIERGDHCRR